MKLWKINDYYANNVLKTGVKYRLHRARGGTLDKILHIVVGCKILYVPIPKVANTSIINMLWRSQGIHIEGNVHKNIKRKPVPMLSDFSNSFVEEAVTGTDWFRFTFVRNPYSRLLSCYRDKILNPERNKNFLKRLGWEHKHLPTFNEFLESIVLQDVSDMDWHWRPQSSLAMTELISYDFIGKIENFDTDIQCILKKLEVKGCELRESLLKPINKSATIPIEINDHAKSLIMDKYAEDFKIFDYSFDIKNMS